MASHFHLFGVVLARFFFPQFSIVDSKTVQRSAQCRSRRELSNECLLAKFGFGTAENEPYHFLSSSSREFEFELCNFEPLICSPVNAMPKCTSSKRARSRNRKLLGRSAGHHARQAGLLLTQIRDLRHGFDLPHARQL